MDSKCFNTSQASDLDQMAISPETVWGHLSSFPPAKARSAQYTRPKMEADEESPAIWRRVLRSPDHRSSQMGAPGNSLYQIETNSPLISGRSPAESATKGSAEYPMKDDGNDPGHMRAVSVGSHDSLGVGQSDQTPRAVSWPHMSDMSSRKGCDDIHAPSAQGIIPNPDWYRYGSPNLSQYRGHAQRFASVGGEPLIESQCSGIGMIPQCHSYSPTQITRSQNVSQENQVEICPGPQQPLYLRVKQNGQAFPAHYRPQTGSESQSYNLYGNHSVYTPIYTVSPENAAPRATMQHSQIKYSQNQRSASTPAYSTPWEGTSSGSQGKIFTCQQQGCGKSFKRAEHLNRHRRMHTGERPFACSEPGCDRRFSRTDNLAAHKKIHRKGKSELSSHSPLMPSQAGDAENEAGSTDPQIDHTCPGSSSPASHNMGNDVSPGAASATRGEVDSGSSRNTAPPRSDCGASDADTDHSPLADRSVAQEISPVSQQLFNSHLQSPRKITTSHDRNGPGVQPSPHPHQIPGYQKSLPRIQQGVHPTLY